MPEILQSRAAGILLHVTSLPGPHFSGDLGPAAHEFVDFLAEGGQKYWQMLPTNPIGDGNSPYSTISSFAGEPLLISPEVLVKEGLLTKAETQAPAAGAGRKVAYAKAKKHRGGLLRKAWERASAPGWKGRDAFEAFRKAEKAWLDDFALFAALTVRYGTPDFAAWPVQLRDRDKSALAAAAAELEDDIRYIGFLQFIFRRQWTALRAHAHAKGVQLIGDLPIFVSARSADVWAARRFFHLDQEGRPTVVAGCPPDAFTADGQLWGNALYNWDALKAEGYDFWMRRVEASLALFDAVRLDHFIGFYRYWEIKASAKNARGGVWRPALGDDFFAKLKKRLGGRLPFIAEDLGAVVPEVRALRDKYALPGMKVLEFAFDGSDEARHHLPYGMPAASAVYTGTHDNHTAKGWYADLLKRTRSGKSPAIKGAKRELANVDAYLGTGPARIHKDLIRMGLGSPANTCIVPIQDWLGEGPAARMNVPGVADGNWEYRVDGKALTPALAKEMAEMTVLFGR